MTQRVEGGAVARARGWCTGLLGVGVVAAVGLRLVALDQLPGEMYGDIAIVYEYIRDIRAGHWSTGFVLSAGPLYHYLATPLVAVFGFNYLGLKLVSVVVSLLTLASLYALGREIEDEELGLLALLVGGISSWLLVYSRLGNSQILVPLLATAALWLGGRTLRRSGMRDAALTGVVSALGLYVYPQSFVLAPVLGLVLAWFALQRQGVNWRHVAVFGGTAAIVGLPFLSIVARDPVNFFSGYIGGKLAPQTSVLQALSSNLLRTLGALHVQGDTAFRGNPAGLPLLDPLSGILFMLGIVFWTQRSRRRHSALLWIPLLLLPLPSILVLGHPAEVPSASRLLGVAPLVYLLVASGLLGVLRRMRRTIGVWAVALLLVGMLVLNAERYFAVYARGLPNGNTPFGRSISDYLDRLPAGTHAYIVGCCWGDAGQPEPKAIQYGGGSRVSHGLIELHPEEFNCEVLRGLPRPAVLVWRPDSALPAPRVAECAAVLQPELHRSPGGIAIFTSSGLDGP